MGSSPATSCFPHVLYTSLLLVFLELAGYLVDLYEGMQNPFDFNGSYFKMNRDEKYFIKSEKSGSCSPYPCSLSIPLALNRLESSGHCSVYNNLHWCCLMKVLFFICI